MSDTPPPPADPTEVPPPWKRGTGRDENGDMRKTQPMPPPTAEEVLTIFGEFRDAIIKQIDERDQRILVAIESIGTRILDHYERETKRGDEHAKELKEHSKWIKTLRKRTHGLSHNMQTVFLRLEEIERVLEIEPPTPEIAPEPEPEPTP